MVNIFPLADKLRPIDLNSFVGQEHLVGKGKIIRTYIENNRLNSLIFWGPPGTGKTTLSRIIVKEMQLPALEFSAAISKLQDAREIMQKAAIERQQTQKPLVLFVDEIHHFNKSAQDAFLPYVERGDIILLGTTTENPAYKMNRALLSRLKVLEFYPLKDPQLRTLIQRSLEIVKQETQKEIQFSPLVENILLNYSQGDARRMLNLVEMVVNVYQPGEEVTPERVLEIIQANIGSYDRTGDDRYQLISAFHKSVRNSDLDAALFWLYRMMEGGEDPLFILRRMIRVCVEDIGLADPQALDVCLRAKEAFEYLGSPEGNLFLTQATVYIATAPKSNSLYIADKKLKEIVEKYKSAPIPWHIINPSNFLAARSGAGKGYLYAHDFKEKTTTMSTMPVGVEEQQFFLPNEMGFEKKIKDRIQYWEKVKQTLKDRESNNE